MNTAMVQNVGRPQTNGKRAIERARCGIPATLKSNGRILAQCVIKDMSARGFRLHLPQAHLLPNNFDIEAFVFAEPIAVELVWSSREYAGVSLSSANDLCFKPLQSRPLARYAA